jgi:hypothetical protein
MDTQIEELRQAILTFKADSLEDLAHFKRMCIGKEGPIGSLLAELITFSLEDRKRLGLQINQLKALAREQLETLRIAVVDCERYASSPAFLHNSLMQGMARRGYRYTRAQRTGANPR